MRTATKTIASWFGIAAGIAGLEHGYFEVLQGSVKPTGLMFVSMGPPCDPEKIWNACEPALTIIPNLLISGILTAVFSIAVLVWAALFVQRKNGGVVLILLCIALLLFGGGVFPPLIGFFAGTAAFKINAPIIPQPERKPGSLSRFFAGLWPWPFVLLLVWLLGQFIVGYFFNDFMKNNGLLSLLLIIVLLPVSVIAANAYDRINR